MAASITGGSSASPAAGIVCDGLPDAAKQQCEAINRLIKENLEDVSTRAQQLDAAQKKLDADRSGIIEKCKQRQTAASACPQPPAAAQDEVAGLREKLKAVEAERDRLKQQPATAPSAAPQIELVRDCEACPPLVKVSAGAAISLGAPHGSQDGATALDPKTPLPAKSFMMQAQEVSVGQFKAYLKDTNAAFERTCLIQPGSGSMPEEVIVKEPSVFQALSLPPPPDLDDHPAVCITREDALGYAAWLSKKAGGGLKYDLPSEIHWEYAARPRAGNPPLPPTQEYAMCGLMNVADSQFSASIQTVPVLKRIGIADRGSDLTNCNDSSALTEPVSRRSPSNPYGLANMLGNVSELTSSCWTPASGAECPRYVVRGGSFASPAGLVTLWARQSFAGSHAGKPAGRADVGFRLMREIPE